MTIASAVLLRLAVLSWSCGCGQAERTSDSESLKRADDSNISTVVSCDTGGPAPVGESAYAAELRQHAIVNCAILDLLRGRQTSPLHHEEIDRAIRSLLVVSCGIRPQEDALLQRVQNTPIPDLFLLERLGEARFAGCTYLILHDGRKVHGKAGLPAW